MPWPEGPLSASGKRFLPHGRGVTFGDTEMDQPGGTKFQMLTLDTGAKSK